MGWWLSWQQREGSELELPKSLVALPCSSLGARVHLWLQQWRRSRRWMFLLRKGAGCHKTTCYIPIFPPLMFREINLMPSSQLRRLNPAQALHNIIFLLIPCQWFRKCRDGLLRGCTGVVIVDRLSLHPAFEELLPSCVCLFVHCQILLHWGWLCDWRVRFTQGKKKYRFFILT